jgi:hypothetical protein
MKNFHAIDMMGILGVCAVITFGILMILAITEGKSYGESYNNNTITVKYNHQTLKLPSEPTMQNNKVYVPVSILSVFGYGMYTTIDKAVTIANANESQVFHFYKNSKTYYVNNKRQNMLHGTLTVNGEMYIHIRFLADKILKMKVDYDRNVKEVNLLDYDIS